MTVAITPKQADIDAAAEYTSRDYPDEIACLAEIIARRAQQARLEERERAAKYADWFANQPASSGPRRDEARAIATAIRKGEGA